MCYCCCWLLLSVISVGVVAVTIGAGAATAAIATSFHSIWREFIFIIKLCDFMVECACAPHTQHHHRHRRRTLLTRELERNFYFKIDR